jgi:hypothetical protein
VPEPSDFFTFCPSDLGCCKKLVLVANPENLLMRELRERGYGGGYMILTDWLRPQREAARAVAVRRFHGDG